MMQPRKVRPDRLVQDRFHAVAVHDIGGMDHGTQHQSFGVHQQMALASFDLLVAVKAAWPTHITGLHGLAIDAAGAGLAITAEAEPERFAQQPVDPLPRPIAPPAPQIGIRRLPGRPFLRQEPPGTHPLAWSMPLPAC